MRQQVYGKDRISRFRDNKGEEKRIRGSLVRPLEAASLEAHCKPFPDLISPSFWVHLIIDRDGRNLATFDGIGSDFGFSETRFPRIYTFIRRTDEARLVEHGL